MEFLQVVGAISENADKTILHAAIPLGLCFGENMINALKTTIKILK